MTLPGVTTTISDSPPANIGAGDTGAWFIAGQTERGPHDAVTASRSLASWVAQHGGRTTQSATMYDAVEAFFREGGLIVYTARVVGDVPVKASDTIAAASGTSMTITAFSAGEWGNDVDVAIDVDGSEFTVAVTDDSVLIATSPALTTVAEAVAWAAATVPNLIVITAGAGGFPNADETANLAGGDDDDDTIGDTDYERALDLFSRDLGPGQVSLPGRTTTQAYTDLLEHADEHKRVALLDGADTHTVATLTAAAIGQRSSQGARMGGLFAPWAVIPGLTAGTTRTVPYSAIQAGMIARADGRGANPNEAAAGENGRSRYALGLSQAAWTDAERETLNDAGVNVAVIRRNEVRTMGDRTLVNALTDSNWVPLSNSRLVMAVANAGHRVMERFEFAQIDGRNFKLGELAAALAGEVLMPLYLAGALYGESPETAFRVDVGPDVNSAESIAENKLRANVVLRVSPRGEVVELEIIKTPVSEAI